MGNADLGPELVKFIATNCSVDKLLRLHRPDASGHCPSCRSMGCTVFAAARDAKKFSPTS